MNQDESVVYDFLKNSFHGSISFEPIPNQPPDFLLNNETAIEVRRLNRQISKGEFEKGIENLWFRLEGLTKKVCSSFSSQERLPRYFVLIEYDLQPIPDDYQKKLEEALSTFLEKDVCPNPHRINVTPHISISLHHAKSDSGQRFLCGGSDENYSEPTIYSYLKNLQKVIAEKSLKIKSNKHLYQEWWLILVDHIEFGLDECEITEIEQTIKYTGEFNRIMVITPDGQRILLSIFKQE